MWFRGQRSPHPTWGIASAPGVPHLNAPAPSARFRVTGCSATELHTSLGMPPEATCMQCRQPISADDTVELHGYRLTHLDCNKPRSLRPEECVYLYVYCWDHTVAECSSCGLSFTQEELVCEPVGSSLYSCLRCRQDLTESIRAHLRSCSELPEQLRQKVQETREATQRLLKRSRELLNQADTAMREMDASRAQLNSTRQDARRRMFAYFQNRLRRLAGRADAASSRSAVRERRS